MAKKDVRVLLVSRDRELGLLRTAVLRGAGIEVVFPDSLEETMAAIQADSFHAMMVCHSISSESASDFAGLFRASNPNGCAIFISPNTWKKPPRGFDVVISGLDGPEALIGAALDCDVAA